MTSWRHNHDVKFSIMRQNHIYFIQNRFCIHSKCNLSMTSNLFHNRHHGLREFVEFQPPDTVTSWHDVMATKILPMLFGLKNSTKRFPIFCNASERTYISACIRYSCAIPTTIPMFSRSRNAKKLFFIMCDASWMQNASRHLGFLT